MACQLGGAALCHPLRHSRANVPSTHNFLEILLGLKLEYDTDDADDFSLPNMCFFISDR